jgi:Fe-S oxidoreductase
LTDYVSGLQAIMDGLGLSASFYGHAASGLLHVRPVVDLHKAGDIAKFRTLAEETSALVKQFKGSIAAEHGVGIARTEFMPKHLGPELLELHRRVKALFDPKGLMNPGKIIPNGRFRFDRDLRWGADYEVPPPFEPVLAFAAKDKSFVGNLEQCNGSGACLKLTPTMCPTYLATGEEIMSTRGRANTVRAVLDGRLKRDGDFYTDELDVALSNCVGCKACATECPSNVNMPLLKAELFHARHKRRGLALRDRIFSRVDWLGALGAAMPALANTALESRPIRMITERLFAISARRPLPRYAEERFDTWFQWRRRSAGERGKVLLWDDCFVCYHEPDVGKAAVRVLGAAGYEVELVKGRVCCGRPAFSTGRLDLAAAFARHNAETLARTAPDAPVVFLEPSCYSMFVDDYRELGISAVENIARRCHLFEEFIAKSLESDGDTLEFADKPVNVAVHAHCHAKALLGVDVLAAAVRYVLGANVTRLDTGCCGMAGAFGVMAEKYDLSMAIAWPFVQRLDALPDDTVLIASGTSCRHQIEHLTNRQPLHAAEFLAGALTVRSEAHAAR